MTIDPHSEARRPDRPGAAGGVAGDAFEPGPPPPPRAVVEAAGASRRRRRRLVLATVAAVVVIGTPVTLAVIAGVSTPVSEPAPEPGAAPDGDADADDLEPPGLDQLTGHDAAWAKLLRAVDDSERAMIAFQDELAEIAERTRQEEASDPLAEVRTAAEDSGRALDEVRPRLVEHAGDGRLDEVRQAYLEHHDAWADYLDAVVEEPTLVGASASASQWRLSINTSGATFARELRGAVRDDRVDPAIRTYARDLLRRGFDEPAGSRDT